MSVVSCQWATGGLLMACLGAGGCAQVGPVLPPTAGLPRPATDFTAVRRGPEIVLRWSAPTATSDGARLRGPVIYELCAWPGRVRGALPPAPPLAPSTPPQVPSPAPSPAGGPTTPSGAILPPCPHQVRLAGPTVAVGDLGIAAGEATLALYALNASGEGAGWSNPVTVSLAPVAPPPELLSATATAAGVDLRWTAEQTVHVYRNGELLASRSGQDYLDRDAAWGQRYTYWLRSANGGVESADSRHLEVVPRDVFPPPAPTGLQAVAAPGVAGVDLSWDSVASADLAGYNVYQRTPGASGWAKLNPALLPTPVFHLAASTPGASYAVTAVDTHGNESQRSPAASPR